MQEKAFDAIISQTNTVTNASTNAQVVQTSVSNVDAIRMQGVELSADKNNVLVEGLQLFGSVTYVDSRILADPSWAATAPACERWSASACRTSRTWRAKAGVTYRPNDSWAYTVAARYSGKQYSTLDNTDIIPTSMAPSTITSWST